MSLLLYAFYSTSARTVIPLRSIPWLYRVTPQPAALALLLCSFSAVLHGGGQSTLFLKILKHLQSSAVPNLFDLCELPKLERAVLSRLSVSMDAGNHATTHVLDWHLHV